MYDLWLKFIFNNRFFYLVDNPKILFGMKKINSQLTKLALMFSPHTELTVSNVYSSIKYKNFYFTIFNSNTILCVCMCGVCVCVYVILEIKIK